MQLESAGAHHGVDHCVLWEFLGSCQNPKYSGNGFLVTILAVLSVFLVTILSVLSVL